MAKSSLTKVKDHRYDWPALNSAERKRKTASVHLNTDSGNFTMKLPEEVVQVLGGHDAVGARDLNDCIREFDQKIKKYNNTIRTQSSKPVLVIHFAYNHPRDPDRDAANLWGVQQLGSTKGFKEAGPCYAFGISYEVLYQIGNALYEVAVDERNGDVYGAPHHRFTLPVQDRRVMDWTEEREAFLASMVTGLENLVERVSAFFASDFAANIDLAIASGVTGFALPAPRSGA